MTLNTYLNFRKYRVHDSQIDDSLQFCNYTLMKL